MKHFILSALVLTIFAGCKSEPKFGNVEFTAQNCKYKSTSRYRDFKIYKTGEINVVAAPKIMDTTLISLEYGEYFVEYKTIFNQKQRLNFSVNTKESSKVELCFDYLDYKANKNLLLMDELSNGDTLIINNNHSGCFDSRKEKLIIYQSQDKLFAEYYGSKHQLSETELRLLREFEIELRSNHSDGCSSRDVITLYSKKQMDVYSTIDGGCNWYGFDNLLKFLSFSN